MKFLQENDGKLSFIRIVSLLAVFMFIYQGTFGLGKTSWEIYLITGLVATAPKVLQKFAEKKLNA